MASVSGVPAIARSTETLRPVERVVGLGEQLLGVLDR